MLVVILGVLAACRSDLDGVRDVFGGGQWIHPEGVAGWRGGGRPGEGEGRVAKAEAKWEKRLSGVVLVW